VSISDCDAAAPMVGTGQQLLVSGTAFGQAERRLWSDLSRFGNSATGPALLVGRRRRRAGMLRAAIGRSLTALHPIRSLASGTRVGQKRACDRVWFGAAGCGSLQSAAFDKLANYGALYALLQMEFCSMTVRHFRLRAGRGFSCVVAMTLVAASASSLADEPLDPRVVAEAARRMQLSTEDVQQAALHGCDDGSTRAMYQCAEYWFISEDLAMNDLFKQLMEARKGKPQQKLLLKSQRAWLAFRDASCEFEASGYLGGTQAAVESAGCAKAATEARNKQLREYASCTADGGCP